ncbi:MAG TPA: hypothetical protein VGY98_04740 [Verrucomicrobiae bacterium]|nr:hypothetical protein [Verrucomicrobiae bacterium]
MTKSEPQNEEQRIELKANKPGKIKAALKAWAASSWAAESDVLKLDEAPLWATNALGEAIKIVFPSRRLPAAGEWDMDFVGEFFGRLQAIAKLHLGEIPMGSEVRAEYDKFQQLTALRPESPEKDITQKLLAQNFKAWLKAVNGAIPQLMDGALGSSHEDALQFQKGLLRGMSLGPDELTTGKTFQRHTRTFWVLGTYWRFWVNCRSVREVYKHLCNAVGEKRIGSFKTFENHVVKKIGLKVRGRGRPKAAK